MIWTIVLLAVLVIVLILCAWHCKSICVVQIQDKYAVRRGVFYYEYKDLMSQAYWWGRDSTFFGRCLTDDMEKAKKVCDFITDKGTKV